MPGHVRGSDPFRFALILLATFNTLRQAAAAPTNTHLRRSALSHGKLQVRDDTRLKRDIGGLEIGFGGELSLSWDWRGINPSLSTISTPEPCTTTSSSQMPSTTSYRSTVYVTTTITPSSTLTVSKTTSTSNTKTSSATTSLSETSASPTPTSSSTSTRSVSTSSTRSTTSSTPSPSPSSGSPIMAAYYPDWIANSDTSGLAPELVDYSRFDMLNYGRALVFFAEHLAMTYMRLLPTAFAIPSASGELSFEDSSSKSTLKKVVELGHAQNTKIVLSIGGWSGSAQFSNAVRTDSNRKNFADSIKTMISDTGIDGVDLDWEYPGTQGQDGNVVSSDDSKNLLTFLKLLRSTLGSSKIISMCAVHQPFVGSDGNPLSDVSEYGKVLDYLLIMNYDVFGTSNPPGPNAPFSDSCGDSSQPQANAVAGIKSWTAAKFPANKLLLGLPYYGYVLKSSATKLAHRSLPVSGSEPRFGTDMVQRAQGSSPSVASSRVSKRATPGDLSQFQSGGDGSQAGFQQLITGGALALKNGQYVGTNGYTRKWDNCSSTPFLVDPDRNTLVTYDDPESLSIKAEYAKSVKLGGINVWDISGDSAYSLTDAVRSALGKR